MEKKILIVMPLMIISLFTSCNNGGGRSDDVSLTTRVKYCTVKGAKDKYNKGEKVSLTFTPYPFFSLPNKEDIFIGGVNDFDYSNITGELSFNITTKTAIMVECYSSFGGKIVSLIEADNFFNIRDKNHLTINSIHFDYEFNNIGEETDEGKYILEIVNSIIKSDTPFTTLKEKKPLNHQKLMIIALTILIIFSLMKERTLPIL